MRHRPKYGEAKINSCSNDSTIALLLLLVISLRQPESIVLALVQGFCSLYECPSPLAPCKRPTVSLCATRTREWPEFSRNQSTRANVCGYGIIFPDWATARQASARITAGKSAQQDSFSIFCPLSGGVLLACLQLWPSPAWSPSRGGLYPFSGKDRNPGEQLGGCGCNGGFFRSLSVARHTPTRYLDTRRDGWTRAGLASLFGPQMTVS